MQERPTLKEWLLAFMFGLGAGVMIPTGILAAVGSAKLNWWASLAPIGLLLATVAALGLFRPFRPSS